VNLFVELLPFALLGAVIGLDGVSFPQAMLSRPIVAATLAGALAGAPERGLLAGAALELVALETLPVGASRYPEWGTAGVVGGALAALHPAGATGALAAAVLAGLLAAAFGARSVVWLRGLVATWAGAVRDELASGSAAAVTGLQLRGLTADLVRGALVTLVALVIVVPASRALLPSWGIGAGPTRGTIVALAAAVAAAAVWRLARSCSHGREYLAAGLAVGLALVAVT
jgi:PTS system mannose-specific IIC component